MPYISFLRAATMVSISLLGALTMRIMYQYLYQSTYSTCFTRALRWLLNKFMGLSMGNDNASQQTRNRIRISIVGAGSVGVMLAEELMHNIQAFYEPACFIDTSPGNDSALGGAQACAPDGA